MLNLVLSFLTCNNIMHILPLPLCGLYSIRAQNGYWQHVVCPCKIVLLTLVAPRGVPDLYLSRGIHTEHARTAYRKTCGTKYQQLCRRYISQTPCHKWNITQARPMSVSDVSCSLQSWVSTTHRLYSQLTFSNTFIKSNCKFKRPEKNPIDYSSYYLTHYYYWLCFIHMPSDNEFVAWVERKKSYGTPTATHDTTQRII